MEGCLTQECVCSTVLHRSAGRGLPRGQPRQSTGLPTSRQVNDSHSQHSASRGAAASNFYCSEVFQVGGLKGAPSSRRLPERFLHCAIRDCSDSSRLRGRGPLASLCHTLSVCRCRALAAELAHWAPSRESSPAFAQLMLQSLALLQRIFQASWEMHLLFSTACGLPNRNLARPDHIVKYPLLGASRPY